MKQFPWSRFNCQWIEFYTQSILKSILLTRSLCMRCTWLFSLCSNSIKTVDATKSQFHLYSVQSLLSGTSSNSWNNYRLRSSEWRIVSAHPSYNNSKLLAVGFLYRFNFIFNSLHIASSQFRMKPALHVKNVDFTDFLLELGKCSHFSFEDTRCM